MPRKPWEAWIPGVLSDTQVGELCKLGHIQGVEDQAESVGYSSIDLSLSSVAFQMSDGSVKPSDSDYLNVLRDPKLAKEFPPTKGIFTLEAKTTYVFKLRERLNGLADSSIYGQATAKSSVGRVDVLARLIVDGMDTYESFDPKQLTGKSGNMYLEITPITFSVKVKPGICLTQLRLFYGKPSDVEIQSDELYQTVLTGPGAKDGSLAVNLENEQWGKLPVAAFCAKGQASTDDAVPLWVEKGKRCDPCKYWRFRESSNNRLKIEKDQFYIIRSKERISLPQGIAIYCRASDETIGEMRIHYAGFVHPFFGFRRGDNRHGTPLIFEVRGHQVDVSLGNDEKMAKLQFYRMSQDCIEKKKKRSPYDDQSLKLSDFFDSWPKKLRKVGNDGTVEAA
jgi:dCTP deaminase